MKFTTLIPLRDNDGKAFSKAIINRILQRFEMKFGGVTVEGVVDGRWVDEADGKHYQDQCLKVSVACERERYDEARRLILQIGRRLGQKAMYFEIQYFDGVQILRMERDA